MTAAPPDAPAPRNGGVSFWWSDLGLPDRRAPLDGPLEADVCIVGGGFTGLWAAYYLRKADPGLQVVVLEQQFCGYGASGRNGGWLSALLPGPAARYAENGGRAGVQALHAAMRGAVDEVLRVCAEEGIDADAVKGGTLSVATSPAQLGRLRAAVTDALAWDPDGTHELLDAGAAAARVRVAGVLGASWSPDCARVHPARLLRGLAHAAEAAGVRIFESTSVATIEPGVVRTGRGDVRARHVLRATEGFTSALPGLRRRWLPMNSSMVVTEPLPAAVWDEIGWAGRETLGDMAHAYIYAQRTADDRIALGGRGRPYRFGSRTDVDGITPAATVAALRRELVRLLPATAGTAIAHTWSGVLGVPRDWCAGVGHDPASGLGWAGGYVGDGVTTSNLAGRTLRDLVLGRDTELTRLPWVNRPVRGWEPEPLRWLGVHALYAAYRAADRQEHGSGTGRTALLARAADLVSGRH